MLLDQLAPLPVGLLHLPHPADDRLVPARSKPPVGFADMFSRIMIISPGEYVREVRAH